VNRNKTPSGPFFRGAKNYRLDEITLWKKWERFRGTAVLINDNGSWWIAHYAMSFLVPSEAWKKVAEINIRTFPERDEK
jgi:hypothetical protein